MRISLDPIRSINIDGDIKIEINELDKILQS